NDPHDVGHGGPGVVRPFILVASDVAKGNPSEVRAAEESGHAPQGRAAHQVAGSVGKPRPGLRCGLRPCLCPDLSLRAFYLPVHFGGRFSRKAMIPSRTSAVEMSSSR